MSKNNQGKKKGGKAHADEEEAFIDKHELGASDDDMEDDDMEGMGMQGPSTQQVLEKLSPSVRARVYALRGIQDAFVATAYDQYIHEMGQLEKKYEALYAPLYARRAAILNGEASPTDAEVHGGIPEGDDAAEAVKKMVDEAAGAEGKSKGVPDFWLHALQHDHELGKLITERDEPALRALTDIRYVLHDDPKNGFTLLFFFDATRNAYFENACLSKRIDFAHENGSVQVTRTVGTDIQWKPHQNLTVLERSKKQRSKKTKDVRVVTVTEPCPSFFRFFLSNTAGEYPEDDASDEDGVPDESHFKYTAEEDHELALTIKDRIIPRAVEFFTGEADSDNDEEDDDDDYDEEDDEEDEDDEEEEVYRPVGRGGKGNNNKGGNKGAGKEQAECKQQ